MKTFTYYPRFNHTSKELRVELHTDGQLYTDFRLAKWQIADMFKVVKHTQKLGGAEVTDRQKEVLANAQKWGFTRWVSATQLEYTELGEKALTEYLSYK